GTWVTAPRRRWERPWGPPSLPGRVSPYPSTTDSSPRTTASTRPGAPKLSHITAPAMDAASLRTISAARAGFAGAPAASIAKITAGRYLFNLGVMALASRGMFVAGQYGCARRSFSPPPAYRPTLTERLPCINTARAGARSMLQAGASSSPGLPLPPSRLHGHTHAADHDPFQIIAR